jgi:hypothetical protein
VHCTSCYSKFRANTERWRSPAAGSRSGDWVGRQRGGLATPFLPAPHRTGRNPFGVIRLSSGHAPPLQDHGSHTPFPGCRTPPVLLCHVIGFPNLGLLRALCDHETRVF